MAIEQYERDAERLGVMTLVSRQSADRSHGNNG